MEGFGLEVDAECLLASMKKEDQGPGVTVALSSAWVTYKESRLILACIWGSAKGLQLVASCWQRWHKVWSDGRQSTSLGKDKQLNQ